MMGLHQVGEKGWQLAVDREPARGQVWLTLRSKGVSRVRRVAGVCLGSLVCHARDFELAP